MLCPEIGRSHASRIDMPLENTGAGRKTPMPWKMLGMFALQRTMELALGADSIRLGSAWPPNLSFAQIDPLFLLADVGRLCGFVDTVRGRGGVNGLLHTCGLSKVLRVVLPENAMGYSRSATWQVSS